MVTSIKFLDSNPGKVGEGLGFKFGVSGWNSVGFRAVA